MSLGLVLPYLCRSRASAGRLRWVCLLALVLAGICQAQPGPLVSWGTGFGGRYHVARGREFMVVCAGGYHSLALTADGALAAWGENINGQCNIPAGRDFVAIAAGLYHSLALRADGTVLAWGNNSRGQCNVPRNMRFLAIAAGDWHSLAIRQDGALVAWGWNDQHQCDVPPGKDYTAISAGHCHSLALKMDRSLVAWGDNGDGQCDVPIGHDFVQVAAGSMHGVALRANGALVAWGRNNEGQCRVPPGNDFVSIAVGSLHGLALTRNGRAVAWGPNNYGQCDAPAEERFAIIAAGGFHSVGIRDIRPRPRAFEPARAMAGDRIGPAPVPSLPAMEAGRAEGARVRTPDSQTLAAPPSDEAAGRDATAQKTEPAPTRPSQEQMPAEASQGDAAGPPDTRAAVQAEPAPEEAKPGAELRTRRPPVTPRDQVPSREDEEPGSQPARARTPEPKPAPAQARTPSAVPAVGATDKPAPSEGEKKPAAQTARTPSSAPADPNVPVSLTNFFRDSIAADALVGVDPNAMPVYHFTAKSPSRHFCTINEDEKYKLIDEKSDVWQYQGIAFFAYPVGKQPPGARPVHRFWSESLDRHFYTMNASEKDMLVNKFPHIWKYEGIAWYAPAAKPKEKPKE